MKDLAVDNKAPWTGPGRDPRGDKWEDIEEDMDADDGEETYIDPSMFMPQGLHFILTTTSFSRRL